MESTVLSTTILIVDDEEPIRDMIRMNLEMAGYRCMEAPDIQQAYISIIDSKPDLVLLDWMLPGSSGIELIRRLRSQEVTAWLPIILLTAKTEEDNKIQGLDAGADDYITKPFAPRELLSRIKALLRRTSDSEHAKPIVVQGLTLDPASHRVFIQDRPVTIGPTEFRLLAFFMTHQERVYSRAQLLDHVWGSDAYLDERTVDVQIRRLRKVLCTHETDYSGFIQTVHGAGYRFSATA